MSEDPRADAGEARLPSGLLQVRASLTQEQLMRTTEFWLSIGVTQFAVKQERKSVGHPPEWHARAIEVYKSGKSIVETAAAVGRSVSRVAALLRRSGIVRRPRQSRAGERNEERLAAIKRDYLAGKNMSEIGCERGITKERVRQLLMRMGVDAPGSGAVSAAERRARDERIVALDAEGKTFPEIAEMVGISHATVGEALRRSGITQPRPRKLSWRTRRAIELFDAGLSAKEITAELGYTSESTCVSTLHRYGRSQQKRAAAVGNEVTHAQP